MHDSTGVALSLLPGTQLGCQASGSVTPRSVLPLRCCTGPGLLEGMVAQGFRQRRSALLQKRLYNKSVVKKQAGKEASQGMAGITSFADKRASKEEASRWARAVAFVDVVLLSKLGPCCRSMFAGGGCGKCNPPPVSVSGNMYMYNAWFWCWSVQEYLSCVGLSIRLAD